MKIRPKTRESLARNLRYLMDHHPTPTGTERWSQTAVADKAGIAQRSVGYMLDPQGPSPKLESVDAVARVFGLEGWHLIISTLIDDLESGTSIRVIYDAYMDSTPEGRRHIQRVAQREQEYGISDRTEDPPTPTKPKQKAG